MKTVPQLVGVTWSKEGAQWFSLMLGKNMQKLGKLGMAPHEIKIGVKQTFGFTRSCKNSISFLIHIQTTFSSSLQSDPSVSAELAGGWGNYGAKSKLAQLWFATSRASGWKTILTMRPDGNWAEKFTPWSTVIMGMAIHMPSTFIGKSSSCTTDRLTTHMLILWVFQWICNSSYRI